MKLKAFTILESMMALVVIMISFTAGMTIYLTVLEGDAFPLKTKAKNRLHLVFEQMKQERRFLDETLEEEGLVIEKKVVPYARYQEHLPQDNIYQVSLKAFDQEQQVVATEEHLVKVAYEQ